MKTKTEVRKFIEECQSHRNNKYVRVIERDFPELAQTIKSRFPANKFIQSLYNYLNDITTLPTCSCGSLVKFINFKVGYQKCCCKKCSNISEERIKHRKETNLKRYGHTNFLRSEQGKKTIKHQIKEKYGVEHYSRSEEFKEKFKSTMQQRYKVDYAMQSKELKKRHASSLQANYGVIHPSQSSEIYKRRNRAMKEKYGVEHAMQSSDLARKHKQTLQGRYQVDYPIQNEEIHSKMKQTMMERHGAEYSAQVDYVFAKLKQTNLEKYGVEFPIQNDEIKEQIKQTNLEKYGVEFPVVLQDEQTRRQSSIKRRQTMEQEGKWISLDLLEDAKKYYRQVWKFTRKQPLQELGHFEKRGLAGVPGAYHLDHKVSIKCGFENNIPPYIIGNLHNLEMLPWKDNVYKSSKCSIPLDVLINQTLSYYITNHGDPVNQSARF